MPTVSVIIPTFNRATMLKEAIESVLEQDVADFELIVVDDGSTDETPAVLAKYPAPPLHIVSQVHQGVSAARNAGLKKAAGGLIAFLDSDDLWLPGKLAAQMEFFENHPEALICQTEEIWLRNGIRVNPKKRHAKPQGMIFDRCVDLCLVSPSAVMIRRALFDMVGLFDEQMAACEDYDLWLRVACRFPIYLIDRPMVIKRAG
ncbi:MAG: glycosyltransferase, partial [Deltaproteobacteria bacterium]|nr:glycosyltransferase [Deltaproteobacteria bacterium]